MPNTLRLMTEDENEYEDEHERESNTRLFRLTHSETDVYTTSVHGAGV